MVIWTRVETSSRDTRSSLSYDRIATAAVELADAGGLDAVSMRKVAGRLGAGTMSLYRYVDSRDDLIELMVDQVHGQARPVTRSGDWRADLAEAARRSRHVALKHPWLAGHTLGRTSLGPNLLRVIESTLDLVDGLGLDIDQMLDLWMTVQTFVQGHVLGEVAEQESQRRTGQSAEEWRERLAPHVREVIASGHYPLVTRLVLEAEDYPDPDQVFERRLGYVLDGLAASLGPDQLG